MNKRYQVFISSTFEDLKEERKEIIETLLNAKYLPSGMEMFSASNEEQFKYIKKIIDDCDYYVLVLGARYGSVNTISGKSFTEMEYEYALEKGIPVLSFVHKDPDNLPAQKREKNNIELFKAFRTRVLQNSKMCKMWSEKSDLVSNVVISLVQIVDECPRIGWSRGEQDTTALLSQINALRIENENLRVENKKLLSYEKIQTIDTQNLSHGDDEFEILGKSFSGREEKYNADMFEYETIWTKELEYSGNVTWNNVFEYVAPEIFTSCDEYSFRFSINQFCEEFFNLEKFEISKRSYNQIKYQMYALGWIAIEEYGYEGSMIRLTEEGQKEFMNIVTLRR